MEKRDFKKMVDDVIIKEARADAMKIIELSNDKMIEDLVGYYDKSNYNIFCLHLDFMKFNLWKESKIEQGGFFGEPFISEHLENKYEEE